MVALTRRKFTIAEYHQLVDLGFFTEVDNRLEVYSNPFSDGKEKFGYKNAGIVLPNETIEIPNFADTSLNLTTIFPR